jgi:hypothetical protein
MGLRRILLISAAVIGSAVGALYGLAWLDDETWTPADAVPRPATRKGGGAPGAITKLSEPLSVKAPSGIADAKSPDLPELPPVEPSPPPRVEIPPPQVEAPPTAASRLVIVPPLNGMPPSASPPLVASASPPAKATGKGGGLGVRATPSTGKLPLPGDKSPGEATRETKSLSVRDRIEQLQRQILNQEQLITFLSEQLASFTGKKQADEVPSASAEVPPPVKLKQPPEPQVAVAPPVAELPSSNGKYDDSVRRANGEPMAASTSREGKGDWSGQWSTGGMTNGMAEDNWSVMMRGSYLIAFSEAMEYTKRTTGSSDAEEIDQNGLLGGAMRFEMRPTGSGWKFGFGGEYLTSETSHNARDDLTAGSSYYLNIGHNSGSTIFSTAGTPPVIDSVIRRATIDFDAQKRLSSSSSLEYILGLRGGLLMHEVEARQGGALVNESESNLYGMGPRVGVAASTDPWGGFSLYWKGSATALIGSSKVSSKAYSAGVAGTKLEDSSLSVYPMLDMDVGLRYTDIVFGGVRMDVGMGLQAETWFTRDFYRASNAGAGSYQSPEWTAMSFLGPYFRVGLSW